MKKNLLAVMFIMLCIEDFVFIYIDEIPSVIISPTTTRSCPCEFV